MLLVDYEEVHKTRSFCFRGARGDWYWCSLNYKGRQVLCEHFVGYYTVALVICLHRLLSIGSENHLQNGSPQSRQWRRYAHERYTFPNDDEYEPWNGSYDDDEGKHTFINVVSRTAEKTGRIWQWNADFCIVEKASDPRLHNLLTNVLFSC